MLLNLYLIPRLLGLDREKLEIRHGSNRKEPEYLDQVPAEYFSLWDPDELQWASALYHSAAFQKVEARYIEIHRELLHLRPGPRRSQLVDEACRLQGWGQVADRG